MGKLFPIKLPPGLFRNGTRYETAGRWYDGNLVRWENGSIKPIGGWTSVFPAIPGISPGAPDPPVEINPLVTSNAFQGVARGGITFTDDHGFPFCLVGTNKKLYQNEGHNAKFNDITPAGFVEGNVDSKLGQGYGAGPYGAGKYGKARATATVPLPAATWQFDMFGSTVVMVQSADRKIMQFDPGDGSLTIVTDTTIPPDPDKAPTAHSVMTTNEDFLLVIGAGGVGRRIQWPDIGTTTDWVPTDINSAGDINLNTAGQGVSGARVGLANLVWTNIDVHLINYIGQPGIYAPTRIGTACGLVGPRAWAVAPSGVSAGETAYWMSQGGFFLYNGAVTPLACEVQDYIWKNINFDQAEKIYASTNLRFHEIIWFFPALPSVECDSYVIYNYKDNIWYYGVHSMLARTTYLDQGSLPKPLGVDPAGVIYEHETGVTANGATRVGNIFITSGPAEIGSGDQVIYSNLMLVDGDGLVDTAGNNVLTMTPEGRLTPQSPVMAAAPIPFAPNSEGYTPVRFSGRQIALRFDATQDAAWVIGKLRLDVVGGSKR